MHWRLAVPHSCYLITLVAGEMSEIRDQWLGGPEPVASPTTSSPAARGRPPHARPHPPCSICSRASTGCLSVRPVAQLAWHFISGMENKTAPP